MTSNPTKSDLPSNCQCPQGKPLNQINSLIPFFGISSWVFVTSALLNMFLIEPSIFAELPTTHLILEKLMMPEQFPRLVRPRLLELLEKSLAICTSTIISARAGAGKTSLAVDFARRCGRRVAWYKVDAPDGELPAFFDYLSASIRQQRPQFCGPLDFALVLRGGADQAVSIAERFVYELAESGDEPLLIVIE